MRHIYIDSNNLHKAAQQIGWKIDYSRLYIWLSSKFSTHKIYIFIGYIHQHKDTYEKLKQFGFILIFKETYEIQGVIKGNCDIDMTMQIMIDHYTIKPQTIIVSGDGDFASVIDFLIKNSAFDCVIAPRKIKCSYLIRKRNVRLIFLDDHYQKFSKKQKPPI